MLASGQFFDKTLKSDILIMSLITRGRIWCESNFAKKKQEYAKIGPWSTS